eukprot:5453355-Amphidinium_carterae.1
MNATFAFWKLCTFYRRGQASGAVNVYGRDAQSRQCSGKRKRWLANVCLISYDFYLRKTETAVRSTR